MLALEQYKKMIEEAYWPPDGYHATGAVPGWIYARVLKQYFDQAHTVEPDQQFSLLEKLVQEDRFFSFCMEQQKHTKFLWHFVNDPLPYERQGLVRIGPEDLERATSSYVVSLSKDYQKHWQHFSGKQLERQCAIYEQLGKLNLDEVICGAQNVIYELLSSDVFITNVKSDYYEIRYDGENRFYESSSESLTGFILTASTVPNDLNSVVARLQELVLQNFAPDPRICIEHNTNEVNLFIRLSPHAKVPVISIKVDPQAYYQSFSGLDFEKEFTSMVAESHAQRNLKNKALEYFEQAEPTPELQEVHLLIDKTLCLLDSANLQHFKIGSDPEKVLPLNYNPNLFEEYASSDDPLTLADILWSTSKSKLLVDEAGYTVGTHLSELQRSDVDIVIDCDLDQLNTLVRLLQDVWGPDYTFIVDSQKALNPKLSAYKNNQKGVRQKVLELIPGREWAKRHQQIYPAQKFDNAKDFFDYLPTFYAETGSKLEDIVKKAIDDGDVSEVLKLDSHFVFLAAYRSRKICSAAEKQMQPLPALLGETFGQTWSTLLQNTENTELIDLGKKVKAKSFNYFMRTILAQPNYLGFSFEDVNNTINLFSPTLGNLADKYFKYCSQEDHQALTDVFLLLKGFLLNIDINAKIQADYLHLKRIYENSLNESQGILTESEMQQFENDMKLNFPAMKRISLENIFIFLVFLLGGNGDDLHTVLKELPIELDSDNGNLRLQGYNDTWYEMDRNVNVDRATEIMNNFAEIIDKLYYTEPSETYFLVSQWSGLPNGRWAYKYFTREGLQKIGDRNKALATKDTLNPPVAEVLRYYDKAIEMVGQSPNEKEKNLRHYSRCRRLDLMAYEV